MRQAILGFFPGYAPPASIELQFTPFHAHDLRATLSGQKAELHDSCGKRFHLSMGIIGVSDIGINRIPDTFKLILG